MNATTKTVIDEIRARLVYGIHLAQDAKTLLSILAEVGALPEKWQDDVIGFNEDNNGWSGGMYTPRREDADDIKAILNRKGGD